MKANEEIQIDEIIEAIQNWQELLKPVQKIKMKEETYNIVAREVQKVTTISEVLDKNRQPLNKLCGVRIEIDNSIKEDYEVVRWVKHIKATN